MKEELAKNEAIIVSGDTAVQKRTKYKKIGG
jgi:hydrogenase maturation factor